MEDAAVAWASFVAWVSARPLFLFGFLPYLVSLASNVLVSAFYELLDHWSPQPFYRTFKILYGPGTIADHAPMRCAHPRLNATSPTRDGSSVAITRCALAGGNGSAQRVPVLDDLQASAVGADALVR